MAEGEEALPTDLEEKVTGDETMSVATTAELPCPVCGLAQDAEMPTDSCQFFYDCVGCGSVIRPQAGDCCVFCSYADKQCPSKQRESVFTAATAASHSTRLSC